MSSKRECTMAVAAFVAFCGTSLTAETYDVTEIGAEDVYAMGLNEKNEAVGYVTPNGQWSEAYAFYWTADGGIQSLGGYAARDINERGQIAGNTASLQAAVWEKGSWTILPNRQNAHAINDVGQVTGLISAQPSIPGPYAPYRDDDIHSPDFIALKRPYEYASHGFDINNRGQVVADCGAPVGLYVGVFYSSDTTYLILDDNGNYDAHARGINDAGQIVGDTRIANGTDRLPVFWASPAEPMRYMGSLGPGFGIAFAISNLGRSVGYSSERAFVWTRDGGMIDLNTLIDPALDLTLTNATDINDRGAIVANGIDARGRQRSYLLTPAFHLTDE